MDEEMRTDAIDIITSSIDKYSSEAKVDIEVIYIYGYIYLYICNPLQLYVIRNVAGGDYGKRQNGQEIWGILALRDGRGFLL